MPLVIVQCASSGQVGWAQLFRNRHDQVKFYVELPWFDQLDVGFRNRTLSEPEWNT